MLRFVLHSLSLSIASVNCRSRFNYKLAKVVRTGLSYYVAVC